LLGLSSQKGIQFRKGTLRGLSSQKNIQRGDGQSFVARKFDPLKRFFKIYIRDFPGASELRDKLMHTKNTSEAREIIEKLEI